MAQEAIKGELAVTGARPRPKTSVVPRTAMHIPALVYLIVFTQLPFVYALWLSLHSWNLLEPALGRPFVGLSNYGYELFHDPEFWPVIWNTGKLVLGALALALVGGTALALLLHRNFRGRGILRVLALVPFLVTPAVNALVWKNLILSPAFGLLDWVLGGLGLPAVPWLSRFPMVSVIIISAWQWTPFFMLVVIAGLQSMPEEVVEAARVDGAGGVQIFLRLVLPHLRHYYELAVLLGTIFIFQTFGKIYIATGGGPGIDTTTLPYYTYQVAFQHWEVGQAAALGAFGVILAIVFAKVVTRYFTGRASSHAA